MLFNLDFANNTTLSCLFFFLLLIIYLYFLIPTVIAQIFNHIADLVILIAILAKEAKGEMQTYPVTLEIKISKCSI